jgi:tRNA-splicing ligase RtcB
MDPKSLTQVSAYEWRIEPTGAMRVPGVIFADEALIADMDEKVREQVSNVAALPGIVQASYAMPDAHWGYGFPIGGVAAFDPEQGGIVSAGGVGFDISCGVRCLTTGLTVDDVEREKLALADALYRSIPAGVGSTGRIRLNAKEMVAMLIGGAAWAVQRGWGDPTDLERVEEHGEMRGAMAEEVSDKARERQRDEMGTLGSGNHYLEVQRVAEVYGGGGPQDPAAQLGLRVGDVVICIHCGSRGLGHQIGTEFLRRMAVAASEAGIPLPERELACAPIDSPVGEAYLGAMRAGINCALANRQILTHLTREVFAEVLPKASLRLLYDVSHNTCKVEQHTVDGERRRLFVHRKGATRAFGPGHPELPAALQPLGQPVLIGGSMGTCSYVLLGTAAPPGTAGSETRAFSSACHGAGRAMSRHAATRLWKGRQVVDELEQRGILIRGNSLRGVAEEAPGAYKDVTAVVDAADHAGLAKKLAKLIPMVCVKG